LAEEKEKNRGSVRTGLHRKEQKKEKIEKEGGGGRRLWGNK